MINHVNEPPSQFYNFFELVGWLNSRVRLPINKLGIKSTARLGPRFFSAAAGLLLSTAFSAAAMVVFLTTKKGRWIGDRPALAAKGSARRPLFGEI